MREGIPQGLKPIDSIGFIAKAEALAYLEATVLSPKAEVLAYVKPKAKAAVREFDLGFGLPAFSSFEAAAAFCVALFVAALCLPGSGLQLPLVPGFLPGVGSKPGQQGFFVEEDFFVVVMLR